MNSKLTALIEESKRKLAMMTDAEKEEMYRQQRDGWIKAEMSWPKSKFTYEDGVKVYASYEDYFND